MTIPKKSRSMFIGESILGQHTPVFVDPHYANEINRPPVSLITGSPGSGKTMFGLLLAAQSSILDKPTVIIDPKGDFPSLIKLYKKGWTNKVEVWSVLDVNTNKTRRENTGMLDPTSFSKDINENVELTKDVIKILAGKITSTQNTKLTPIIKDVIEAGNPSLKSVFKALLRSPDVEVRSLGIDLQSILELDKAQILVANKHIPKRTMLTTEGTVVASLMGLDFPPSTKDKDDYTSQEKITICVMMLLSKMIQDSMFQVSVKVPKTLIIDEAWAIMASASGKSMINSVALYGRSKNMAMLLLTQSPLHLKHAGLNIEQTISAQYAFKNNSKEDNLVTCEQMKLPKNEGWENIMPTLGTGSCLMKDVNDNFTFISVLIPDDWIPLFNTNPTTQKQEVKVSEN